jgi:hypothetical protein
MTTIWGHLKSLKRELSTQAERAYSTYPLKPILDEVFVPVILEHFASLNPELSLIETEWYQWHNHDLKQYPIVLNITKDSFKLGSAALKVPTITEIYNRRTKFLYFANSRTKL